MVNFYNRTRKFDKIGVLIFSLLFMTVGFLQTSSLTFGNIIISVVQWPTIALGMIILLERFINFKHYIKTRGIILLIIFAVGYFASSILTVRYGWYSNLRFLIFMVFQFGILYATDYNENPEDVRKRLVICTNFMIIGTAILSILSFAFMIFGYSKTILPETDGNGPVYYVGFMIGRLFGAYWDPNIAAVMASISALLSLHFFLLYKRAFIKALYVFNMVLQFFYISFSGSRTGGLALVAGVSIYVLLIYIKKKFFKERLKNIIVATLIVVIAFCTTWFGPSVVKIGCNSFVNLVASDKNDEDYEEKDIFDRGYDLSDDISNRRFDIWGGAIEVFKTSPVLGVSRANILSYVDDNLPDSYLVTNEHMRFESMHNTYFEILVSQGLVGIVTFLSFIVLVVIGVVKYRKALYKHLQFPFIALALGICASVCVCSLLITEIVYVISPISTMLWISIGSMNYYINKTRIGGNSNENA